VTTVAREVKREKRKDVEEGLLERNSSTKKEEGISNSNALAQDARDFFPFPPASHRSLNFTSFHSQRKKGGQSKTEGGKYKQKKIGCGRLVLSASFFRMKFFRNASQPPPSLPFFKL
jgi:hypothetical protein